MGFWQKLTGFFNRKERREQEKEVKAQERKWWQFWKRKPTEPEPGENVPEEDEAPWRVDSAALMEPWEKQRAEAEERAAKEADLEKKKAEREKARKTLNTRYGLTWSEEDYNDFWDAFGDGDIARQYGSDVIIYAQSEAASRGMELEEFLAVTKEVINEASGLGYNQMEMADRLYERIREYEA